MISHKLKKIILAILCIAVIVLSYQAYTLNARIARLQVTTNVIANKLSFIELCSKMEGNEWGVLVGIFYCYKDGKELFNESVF